MARIRREDLKLLLKQRAGKVSVSVPPLRQKVNSTSMASMPASVVLGESLDTLIEGFIEELDQRARDGGGTVLTFID